MGAGGVIHPPVFPVPGGDKSAAREDAYQSQPKQVMQTPPATAGSRSYDLHLRSGGHWLSSDHGVTLSDDTIAWVERDERCEARLRDIAEVHLQTGSVGDNTIASCRLNFRDGETLLIASNNSRGLQDDEHDTRYAAFALDLHARLAALKDARIAFTAGFGAARYRFGKVVIVIAVLFGRFISASAWCGRFIG